MEKEDWRMDKLEEDRNGLQLWFLKACEPNIFKVHFSCFYV